MRRDKLLIALTGTGSALCWWPLAINPSLDLPVWAPFVCIATCTILAAGLCSGHWLRFAFASSVGTFAGLAAGSAIWPSDPIGAAYAPFIIAVATLVAALVSLVASLIGRTVALSMQKRPAAVWFALSCCVAVGPIALALTPPLVAHRITRNDRVAAERFTALKNAVERTVAATGSSSRICDGLALRRGYSGPPFSDEDWHRITGNYVRQDGYIFMVYCREKGGYTIDAHPATEKGAGMRRFCTDESRGVGCSVEWNRSRYACLPCTQ